MSPKYTVWFVDDLPRNRATFETNHGNDFAIETFSKTSDVLARIHDGEYPDALLCDIFFYDTVEEAERVEVEKVVAGNCSPFFPPSDQQVAGSERIVRAARMAARGLRPLRRPVATMEQRSA